MSPVDREERVKYPSTVHLPWSPGASEDDIISQRTFWQPGESVVITEKKDGENTSMYRDGVTARSLDTLPHPSRTWVRALHGTIAHDIPKGWRICGENVFAEHSLHYEDLPGYFLVFSVWTEENICLSWAETKEWAALLGLPTVPEIYIGPWNEDMVRKLKVDTSRQEGYVVRSAGRFAFTDFQTAVAKWVRRGHVQTDQHWLQRPVVPNGLVKGVK